MSDPAPAPIPLAALAAGDLLPRTGNPSASRDMSDPLAFRSWNGSLRRIYVQNPNHKAVFKALDRVIAMGVEGEYQVAVRNSAASFAGKSAAGDAFVRIVEARGTYPATSRPVVRVELEQACTSRRFWTAILSKYGVGFSATKDEESLRNSVYDAISKNRTVLLIIDEVQHAGYRSSGSSAATDVIKRFISDGKVGLALFGNEEAKELLQLNNQLGHRMIEPCDIEPLDITLASHQALFAKFLKRYDRELVSKTLFTELSDLGSDRIALRLMAASKGYLGRVVALLRVAARHAYEREAERIEIFDLAHACSSWAVAQKLTPQDPFRFGMAAANG